MKLTKDHKDIILKHAVTAVFQKREDAIKKEENKLAILGYEILYPLSVRTKMDSLPDEFFNQKSTIYLHIDGSRKGLSLASSKKVAAVDNDWQKPFWPDGGDRVSVKNYFKKAKKLASDKDKFVVELRGFLEGINTTNQLTEIWPDGEEYYRWLTQSQKPQYALVARPDKINEMILTMQETD